MKAIQRFTASLEKVLHDNHSLFRLYAAPYENVVKREIKLGDISSNDTILNLGCGALPFTAVHLAEVSGAEVYAVDKDKTALIRGKKLVQSMGLSHRIHFLKDDCMEDVPVHFDKALVALQVEPKLRVVENLLFERNGPVIVRAPRKRFEDTYGEIPDREPKGEVKHNMLTFNRSVLFDH